MKILLLGKNGQVGWELQRSLAPLGQVIALDRHSVDYCGDLTRLEELGRTVRALRPDVIVNAAAYTAVDKAESESSLAHTINAEALVVLATEASRLGALLVHYSTDYVFDGQGERPWVESDRVAPLNTYGKSKLDGEIAIVQSNCQHLIFRTSWVYAARGNNFVKTMLKLGQTREALSVVADQYGAPTGAELLADVTAHSIAQTLAAREKAGVYHLAASGETSWHAYAMFVFEVARRLGLPLKISGEAVAPVSGASYLTPATRPNNSRLNTDKLQAAFDLHLPDWRLGVERMLTELLETAQ